MRNNANSKQQEVSSWIIWVTRLLTTLLALVALGGVLLIYCNNISSYKQSTSLIDLYGLLGSVYTGWILLGAALAISLLFYNLRRYFLIPCAIVLVAIITLTLITPPFAAPLSSADTFTLPVSKINSDLSALTDKNVVVILIVNGQEYRYNAQIVQISKNGTLAVCSFVTPTPTPLPIASASPTTTPAPCLSSAVDTVSVRLSTSISSDLDNFLNLLPTVSAIYIEPSLLQ